MDEQERVTLAKAAVVAAVSLNPIKSSALIANDRSYEEKKVVPRAALAGL